MDRIVAGAGVVFAAVADFDEILQAQLGGEGHLAVDGNADRVHRHHAAFIFVLQKPGAADGVLKPGAVMIRGVVITDGGVETSGFDVQPVLRFVLQQQPLNIEAEIIVVPGGENGLGQHREILRDLRGDKDVQLAQRKGVFFTHAVARVIRHITKPVKLEVRKTRRRQRGHGLDGRGRGNLGAQIFQLRVLLLKFGVLLLELFILRVEALEQLDDGFRIQGLGKTLKRDQLADGHDSGQQQCAFKDTASACAPCVPGIFSQIVCHHFHWFGGIASPRLSELSATAAVT